MGECGAEGFLLLRPKPGAALLLRVFGRGGPVVSFWGSWTSLPFQAFDLLALSRNSGRRPVVRMNDFCELE